MLHLSAFEKSVLEALAGRAGTASKMLSVWASMSTSVPQTARSLTSAAQLGLTEERGAREVLVAACRVGLAVDSGAGYVLAAPSPGMLPRISLALAAIEHYKASIHADATTAHVVLTKPPRPCVLEDNLAALGWKTAELEPTEHAFKRLVQTALTRVVVMTPFFDVTGALWLKELFTDVPSGVQKILVLRSLEDSTRADYPRGFDTIAPWLASTQVEVYNYSISRYPSAGRETFHAKVVLCDDDTAYVGSANVNAASLEHSMEMGVAMKGRGARDVAAVILAVLSSATRMF